MGPYCYCYCVWPHGHVTTTGTVLVIFGHTHNQMMIRIRVATCCCFELVINLHCTPCICLACESSYGAVELLEHARLDRQTCLDATLTRMHAKIISHDLVTAGELRRVCVADEGFHRRCQAEGFLWSILFLVDGWRF